MAMFGDRQAELRRVLQEQTRAIGALKEHISAPREKESGLTQWIGLLLTAAALLASGTYFITQRPTVDVVEKIVDTKQKPISDAVSQAAVTLNRLSEDMSKVHESQIRSEALHDQESSRPPSRR